MLELPLAQAWREVAPLPSPPVLPGWSNSWLRFPREWRLWTWILRLCPLLGPNFWNLVSIGPLAINQISPCCHWGTTENCDNILSSKMKKKELADFAEIHLQNDLNNVVWDGCRSVSYKWIGLLINNNKTQKEENEEEQLKEGTFISADRRGTGEVMVIMWHCSCTTGASANQLCGTTKLVTLPICFRTWQQKEVTQFNMISIPQETPYLYVFATNVE